MEYEKRGFLVVVGIILGLLIAPFFASQTQNEVEYELWKECFKNGGLVSTRYFTGSDADFVSLPGLVVIQKGWHYRVYCHPRNKG